MNRALMQHVVVTSVIFGLAEILIVFLGPNDLVMLSGVLIYVFMANVLYEVHKKSAGVEWVSPLRFGHDKVAEPLHQKLKWQDVYRILLACVVGLLLGLLLLHAHFDWGRYASVALYAVMPVLWVIDTGSIVWSYAVKVQ